MNTAHDRTERRRRPRAVVALSWLAVATMTLGTIGCSGGDDDDVSASATTRPEPDETTTTTERSSGGSGELVPGECPVTDDDVSSAVGSEMPADGTCRWFDGVITIEVLVQGGAELMDGKAFIESRGYEVKDLDRGDVAFLGTREVEAHAEVEVGDSVMTIGMSGLDGGVDRFESIALALIDAALA